MGGQNCTRRLNVLPQFAKICILWQHLWNVQFFVFSNSSAFLQAMLEISLFFFSLSSLIFFGLSLLEVEVEQCLDGRQVDHCQVCVWGGEGGNLLTVANCSLSFSLYPILPPKCSFTLVLWVTWSFFLYVTLSHCRIIQLFKSRVSTFLRLVSHFMFNFCVQLPS